ncbi:hypothetical protein B0H16DRAFT_1690419, partial [Mycena metata]
MTDWADWEYEFLCQLSSLSPRFAGPDGFIELLEEALAFYTSGLGAVQLKYWFTDYLSREPYTEDDYFDVAVVIGRHDGEPEISLRRVSGFDSEENHWKGIVQNSTNGQEVVILDDTFYGPHKGDPIFCWERPYQYFESWMRSSCTEILSLGDEVFKERFYGFIDTHRYLPSGVYKPLTQRQIS